MYVYIEGNNIVEGRMMMMMMRAGTVHDTLDDYHRGGGAGCVLGHADGQRDWMCWVYSLD